MQNVIVVLGVVVLSIVHIALFASPPASPSTQNKIGHDTDEGDSSGQDFNSIVDQIIKKAKGTNPDLKEQAVREIVSALEKTHPNKDKLVAALVKAEAIKLLVEYLSDYTTIERHSLPPLLTHAANALALLAEQLPNEATLHDALGPSAELLKMPGIDVHLLKNLAKLLVNLAQSHWPIIKLHAVIKIREVLERSETMSPGNKKMLIDGFIGADVIKVIIECLPKSRRNNILHYNDNQLQNWVRLALFSNMAQALVVIAAENHYAKATKNVITSLMELLKTPTAVDDKLLKSVTPTEDDAEGLMCVTNFVDQMCAKGKSSAVKDSFKDLLSLTESWDKSSKVFQSAVRAACHIVANELNSDTLNLLKDVETPHIQTMIEICADKMSFCEIIKKESKNGCKTKISTEIVSALETILLDETHDYDDEKLVEQIEACHDEIEKIKGNEQIFSLLQERDIWYNYSIDCTEKTIFEVPKIKAKDKMEKIVTPTSHSNAILLYGASGTGKLMLAQAAAYRSHAARLFIIKASEIIAKKENDAIEFIKMVFRLAKKAQPSVVIFIEIDALLGKNVTHSLKEEFLAQMKANDPSEYRALVLGLTTQPWEMDKNALDHFAKQIHFEMPDETARKEIFEKFAQENSKKVKLDEEKIKGLASMTKNYSFLELMTSCQKAILQLCPRAPTMADLKEALEKVEPKNSEETVKKFANFEKLHTKKP